MDLEPTTALLAASAVHLGFQLVVTVLTYPALADTPPDRWSQAHGAHSRRITWLVAPLYLAVVGASVWAVTEGPDAWGWTAVAGNALACLVTATVAAPLHGRLGRGHDPALLRRLRAADVVRTLGAGAAVVAAVVAAS